MIYTVTLNPSIDYSVCPKTFREGAINRSESEIYAYGGKGINVSAMLANLGVESVALGFVGGFSGKEIARLVRRAGIECDFCEICENSRINIKILSETETAVNGKGPFIRFTEEHTLLDKLKNLSEDDIVVISGSSPESESGKLLENVLAAASHTQLIADMEGAALGLAIEKKPFLIKPNAEELAAFFGKSEMDELEIAKAAAELRDAGIANVLVSRGENGALLASDDGMIYKLRAPETQVVSTVGAGDSMLAGFLAGYDRGPQFALALGVAAGSATAANAAIAEYEEVMNVFLEM